MQQHFRSWNAELVGLWVELDPAAGPGRAVIGFHLADAAQGDDDMIIGHELVSAEPVDVRDLPEQLGLGVSDVAPHPGGGDLHMEVPPAGPALDEQRGRLQLRRHLREGGAWDADGEVGAQVRHEVAPGQGAGIAEGDQGEAGGLDRAERENHGRRGGDVDPALIRLDRGDAGAVADQPQHVAAVDDHEPLTAVVPAGLALRGAGGLDEQGQGAELVEREEAGA